MLLQYIYAPRGLKGCFLPEAHARQCDKQAHNAQNIPCLGNRAELWEVDSETIDRTILNCSVYWGAIAHLWNIEMARRAAPRILAIILAWVNSIGPVKCRQGGRDQGLQACCAKRPKQQRSLRLRCVKFNSPIFPHAPVRADGPAQVTGCPSSSISGDTGR